jgi:1-acyl-sn-glycerol-3-phosphate acyltransferase
VQGSQHVPQTGGCLLASNHASFMDPPALSCAIKHRVVRFMARDTLFKEGLRSWFMHGVAAFPISRERGDVGALKKCIQLLKGGDCVGIFPGRHTHAGWRVGAGQTRHRFFDHGRRCAGGPAYIDGTFAAFRAVLPGPSLAPVRIHFGPPIQPEELEVFGKGRDSYEKVAHLVMERIRALKPTST